MFLVFKAERGLTKLEVVVLTLIMETILHAPLIFTKAWNKKVPTNLIVLFVL
jgi:hypothetical protein